MATATAEQHQPLSSSSPIILSEETGHATTTEKAKDYFRVYDAPAAAVDNSSEETAAILARVEATYRAMLENQTIEYVSATKARYSAGPFKPYSLWSLMDLLNTIKDDSDPDTELAQIVHCFQTGESIMSRYMKMVDSSTDENKGGGRCVLQPDISIKDLFDPYEWSLLPKEIQDGYDTTLDRFYSASTLSSSMTDWSWLPLAGFIHDLGKVIVLPEFGGCQQWSAVGDTFPLELALDANYVFYEKNYHQHNPTLQTNTRNEGCGFDKLHFSYGHDEYLAAAIERSDTKLPPEAVYLIRYHSFYSWHTPRNGKRGYTSFASAKDWKMLPLLKAFQKADLYSKSRVLPEMKDVMRIYGALAERFHVKEFLL